MFSIFILMTQYKTGENPELVPNNDLKIAEEDKNNGIQTTNEESTVFDPKIEAFNIEGSNNAFNPLEGIEQKKHSVQIEGNSTELSKEKEQSKDHAIIEMNYRTPNISNFEAILTPDNFDIRSYNALSSCEDSKSDDDSYFAYHKDTDESIYNIGESSELHKQEVCVKEIGQNIKNFAFELYSDILIHFAFKRLSQMKQKMNSLFNMEIHRKYLNNLVIQFLKDILGIRFYNEKEKKISKELIYNIILLVVGSYDIYDQKGNKNDETTSGNNETVIRELKYYIAINIKNYERLMMNRNKAVSDQKMPNKVYEKASEISEEQINN